MITIFVSGGNIQHVLGPVEYIIVDYDNLNDGDECPKCHSEMEDLICGKCGINYSAPYGIIHDRLWPIKPERDITYHVEPERGSMDLTHMSEEGAAVAWIRHQRDCEVCRPLKANIVKTVTISTREVIRTL